MNTITFIGFSIILLYSITQILKFYGVGEDMYGVYLLFYNFLLVTVLVLPNDEPSVKTSRSNSLRNQKIEPTVSSANINTNTNE